MLANRSKTPFMRIGIDLGGTKIEIVALEPDGTTVVRRRIATPVADYASTIESLGELVEHVEALSGRRGTVGVGTPGSRSPRNGLMRNANSTALNGKPLLEDLERRLRRDVRVENDANCFTLSEAGDGAAAASACVFGVILGTGVGGGVVVRGSLVTGPNGVAGEWGHNPLPWPNDAERPGPACYCGKRGCIETFLSGPGFASDYAAAAGASLAPPAIVAAAAAGDGPASAALERYLDRLARSLATVVNVIDPDTIVLGGGLSNVAPLYAELAHRLPAYVFSDVSRTRIVPPAHGDSSGVRGAAWLWPPV
jgi:fructokinase